MTTSVIQLHTLACAKHSQRFAYASFRVESETTTRMYLNVTGTSSTSRTSSTWKQNLCDCFSSAQCPLICCSVYFCFPCTVAQVATIASKTYPYKCIALGGILVLLTTFSLLLQLAPGWALVAGQVFAFSGALMLCMLVVYARHAIRSRHKIKASLGVCEDILCASCFCSMCTVCQLFAQEDIGGMKPYLGPCDTYGNYKPSTAV